VFLLKFKSLLVLLLTKGKLLLLGLTKTSTLFSMLLSVGVYWTVWGWPFAVGLVLSIYVHEMGHVYALNRFGFKATAPMFIPGVGALIRLRQHPVDPREDARIGLAGPIWGLAAALASLAIWLLTRQTHAPQPIFAAIARVGAWINLFNLLPVWSLDGGRGFRAMSRGQRWLAVAVVGAAWFVTHESLLALIGIVAVLRAVAGPREEAAQGGDTTATIQYAGLVAALSALSALHVPGAATR
jgi:Zn-dependent protease